MKALNEKEWTEFQERVKEKDRTQGNLIGVNLFAITLTNKKKVDEKNEKFT